MKTVEHMLVMDVDGVITNLKNKKANPQILQHLYQELKKGLPLALNTGRSLDAVVQRVINQLTKGKSDKGFLKNLIVVGEKGGTWMTFDDQGNLIENKDDNISVPDDLKNEVRNLIDNKYFDSMFYDESKLTMISTEMIDGYSIEDYGDKQKILSQELEALLANKKLKEKFKVDPTTIATDVENRHVGKNFAVRRVIEWVEKKGINPQKYIALGDSFKSDIPMAQELHSQELPVEFIYVGKENIDTSKYPFPIKKTQEKFDKGTIEFLKTL